MPSSSAPAAHPSVAHAPLSTRVLRAGLLAAALVIAPATISAQTAASPTAEKAASTSYGPAKGTLRIAGGGSMADTPVMERFIAAAGGPSARFVIVPTAGGNFDRDGKPIPYDAEKVLASWKARGLSNVQMLHTHDSSVANQESVRFDRAQRGRRMVQWRTTVEHRGFVRRHEDI